MEQGLGFKGPFKGCHMDKTIQTNRDMERFLGTGGGTFV